MPAVKSFSKSQDGRGSYVIEYIETICIEGHMGIAVLSFFSSGILVILILMYGIAVSSSLTICGFSSFSLNGIQ